MRRQVLRVNFCCLLYNSLADMKQTGCRIICQAQAAILSYNVSSLKMQGAQCDVHFFGS